MRKVKKIGIGIGVGILIFFIVVVGLGTYLISIDDTLDSEQPIITEQPIIVTKNLEELLPTREDVGTIWKISNTNPTSYEDQGNTERDGKKFSKDSSLAPTVVTTILWKWDTIENLENYYDDRIERLIEGGGYEEIKVNATDAICYGTYNEGTYNEGTLLYETVSYRCMKDNVYLRTTTTSSDFDAKSLTGKFTRIILDKIN